MAGNFFAKGSQSLEICVSVNNNLCINLASPVDSSTTSEGRFNFFFYFFSFFIPDLYLLSCELDNFTFNVLH